MSASDPPGPQDLRIRHFVYHFFAEHTRPPAVEETAGRFSISVLEAKRHYHRLHQGHFFFLEPGTDSIRMANPFSAVPTPFRVFIEGKAYFANCAWDMFGIPAALGKDADIEARCADCGEPFDLGLRAGRLSQNAGIVHFLVPFAGWYTDLVFT